jgi:two-component system, OmpR family, response regulator PhoP
VECELDATEMTEVGRAPARVAVVEDDADLRDGILVPGLNEHGFAAVGMASAAELYRRLVAEEFDIVVLDIGLPDESGFEVARHLRSTSAVGIVMLTARGELPDHLRGLADGADAYLAKPVTIDLLVATLRSLSRRMGLMPAEPVERAWRIHADGWRLLAPNGRIVELSEAERSLLRVLIKAAGRPVSRETLIAELAEDVHEFDPHRLEMMVHRLRRRVAEVTDATLPVRAVRGKGYLFVSATADSI